MSAKTPGKACFIDSNVWLYILLSGQDDVKANIARRLVRTTEAPIFLSTQIINEVVNSLLRHDALNEAAIRELISSFYARYTVQPISESMQLQASHLREAYSLSHWDSLVIAAALHVNATTLFTEDMHNGLIVAEHLTIVNPFL